MRQLGILQLCVLGLIASAQPLLAQELWLKPDASPIEPNRTPQLLAQSAIATAPSVAQQSVPPPLSTTTQSQPPPVTPNQLTVTERRPLINSLQQSGDLQSLSLPPPTQARDSEDDMRATTGRSALFTVISSLAVVLGLFFGFVWLSRRALPKSAGGLSADVVQVLGRTAMGNRQSLQLIRLGNRLLLVSVTATGANTLAEVTDPQEVQDLLDRCNGISSEPTSPSFRDVLMQLSRNPNAATPTGLT